jgi:hypothetical protein
MGSEIIAAKILTDYANLDQSIASMQQSTEEVTAIVRDRDIQFRLSFRTCLPSINSARRRLLLLAAALQRLTAAITVDGDHAAFVAALSAFGISEDVLIEKLVGRVASEVIEKQKVAKAGKPRRVTRPRGRKTLNMRADPQPPLPVSPQTPQITPHAESCKRDEGADKGGANAS